MNAEPAIFVRVAAFLPRSLANGPGVRSVLWAQGCPIRCPGCFNPDFLPQEGGELHSAAEIAEWILRAPDTEGVTFSGGEPFLQAGALAEAARRARAGGKSVIVFSGYEWEQLNARENADWGALLEQADAVIAGPYRKEIPSRHPLMGSGNKRVICLTDRYRPEDFTARPGRRVEFHIAPDGVTTVTGFPRKDEG